MKPPMLIGVAGKARSGKNTTADFIEAQYGGYQYSFANPLRAMLKAGFGIDLDIAYWQDRKENEIPALGKSPRQMMQTLGTEWGRQLVHPDLWVILAADKLRQRGGGMIVTDVRFENEATWIRKMQGVVIHVTRESASTVAAHTSENGLQVHPQDIQLVNNGGLEELQHTVSRLFSES